ENPPSVRHQPVAVQRGAGVEDEGTCRLRLLDPLDRRAAVGALRVIAAGEYDGHRSVVGGGELDALELAPRSRGERAEEIALQTGQDRLSLGVAEATVELEHLRSFRRQ